MVTPREFWALCTPRNPPMRTKVGAGVRRNSPATIFSQSRWKARTVTWKFSSSPWPMRLWMPMTLPCMSKSGPPESPPRSLQSDWMVLVRRRMMRPTRRTTPRSSSKPPGCPSEKHQSPGIDSPASAISATGYSPSSRILMSPASAKVLLPSDFAFTRRPSGRTMKSSAPGSPLTWAAVRT